MKRASIASLILAGLLAAGGSAAAQQATELKFAYWAPATDSTWISTIKPYLDAVNAEAKGLIEIRGFPNGALSRNPAQQPQIVLDGVADIAFAIFGLSQGRFPDNALLELPGVFRDISESTKAFTRLTEKGKLRGYEDFVVLGAFGIEPSALHSKVLIKSYKDIAGKRIRSANANEARTLRALGASVTIIPGIEAAEAIARGTLDGTTMQVAGTQDFGVDRVTTSHYFGRFSSSALGIIMARKKFDSLPPKAQEALKKYGGDWLGQKWIDSTHEKNEKGLAAWRADPKRTITIPSKEEWGGLQQIYNAQVDEFIGKDPALKEAYAALQAELVELRKK